MAHVYFFKIFLEYVPKFETLVLKFKQKSQEFPPNALYPTFNPQISLLVKKVPHFFHFMTSTHYEDKKKQFSQVEKKSDHDVYAFLGVVESHIQLFW
jgi:hypothetical protein